MRAAKSPPVRAIAPRPSLPATLRIGPHLYEVKEWNKLAASNAKAWGYHDPETQTILVSRELNIQHELDVLIHEIHHAIYWAWRLDDAKEDEESRVLVLGTAWAQIVRDNPDLLAYLTAAHNYLATEGR